MATTEEGGPPVAATVLLVEDDANIASFQAKGLRRQGLNVEWVPTGAGALARLDRGGVDLLVLDLGLPDIDGLQVIEAIRRRGMDFPVIVVTGRTDPRDRAAALSMGIKAYLTKPFPWADLLTAVRSALGENT